ncbi:MAG: Asp23/Gls24 family envelope stress response protein [Anaerolineae bacterium]|nr:Asp23/Gls24 family envelope stress response protein [Anaerolineae bacterium]
MEEAPTVGKITIDPEALETIARLTTLAIPGVVRLTPPEKLQRFLKIEDGVYIKVLDGAVEVDLYLVAEPGKNLLSLGRHIQTEVGRAISNLVGMPVKAVNVHIEDVCCGHSEG